ncbi:unnamed protein product [Trifolium pratense]|uniref:Uncharacterized protein n=1 Tax=Trifolium pratense TaxID=57577 RepID=A0ACB0K3L8_TRIPR|nr:unnamed protein product [Trifolium pratense]
MTLNHMNICNPATFFGIYVHSSPINLVYSDVSITTSKLKKHFQPRKSCRLVLVNLVGKKVPLYVAGSTIIVSQTGSIEVVLYALVFKL